MLICAALSREPSRLILDGFSADIEATMQCLEALGAQLTQGTAGLLIALSEHAPANAKLDVGESGSTLRFLLPVLGALGVQAEIQMHGRLPERPLSPLWEVLRRMGCSCGRTGPSCIRLGNYARETIPARQCFLAVYFRAFVSRCRF